MATSSLNTHPSVPSPHSIPASTQGSGVRANSAAHISGVFPLRHCTGRGFLFRGDLRIGCPAHTPGPQNNWFPYRKAPPQGLRVGSRESMRSRWDCPDLQSRNTSTPCRPDMPHHNPRRDLRVRIRAQIGNPPRTPLPDRNVQYTYFPDFPLHSSIEPPEADKPVHIPHLRPRIRSAQCSPMGPALLSGLHSLWPVLTDPPGRYPLRHQCRWGQRNSHWMRREAHHWGAFPPHIHRTPDHTWGAYTDFHRGRDNRRGTVVRNFPFSEQTPGLQKEPHSLPAGSCSKTQLPASQRPLV